MNRIVLIGNGFDLAHGLKTRYVTNDKMSNLTLRERLGIDKHNYPMASRIIRDTLIAGKINEEKTENQSRNYKGYVSFWA